jgi:formate dehydrogenase major subunit
MKLIKKRDLTAKETASVTSGVLGSSVDRRAFLRRAGLGLGGTAVAASLPTTMVRRAEAASGAEAGGDTEIRHSVCTHCSVGCGVVAEVQNGVWTGQEPDFDSPFNLGSHCAKGASVREHGHGERRLKYPMKLTGGKWTRVSWDQAIEEIGDKGLGEIQQRAGLPVPQVRGTVGDKQRRPPGPHLSLDDGRRRSQYLGLRGDDQLVQRHAQLQGDVLHRQ